MKLLHSSLAVSVLAGLLLLTTCKKHDLPSNGNPGIPPNYNNPNTSKPVLASVAGTIVDDRDNPLGGVTVRAAGKSLITDLQGYFRFDSIMLDKSASLVTAEHTGYFKAFRVFPAGSNDLETIRIKLIPKDKTGTVAGSSGGSVTLPDNAQITLGAGAVINKLTNQPYTGTVSVYAATIDPTAADIGERVPGSFLAVDKNNQRVVLRSYGMMNMELEGASGEPLQLAPGKKASVKFAIPTSQVAQAPATIDLWSVDETTGLWKDENLTATKSGNFYVAEVTHFSSWNCDIPDPTVLLIFTLRGPGGDTIKLTPVRIRTTGPDPWSAQGYSDLTGEVKGNVPMGKPLHVEVRDNCHHIVYEQDVPALYEDKDLGVVTITPSQQSMVTFKGIVTNCSGQPLASGNVQIFFQDQIYVNPITNGSYNFTTARCPDPENAIVYAIDQSGHRSTPQNVLVNAGTVTVPPIQLCGSAGDEFIDYSIDNKPYSIKAQNQDLFYCFVLDTTVYIAGNSVRDTTIHFTAFFSSPSNNGSITTSDLLVMANNQVFVPLSPVTINITHYAATVGQYMEGNFKATLTAPDTNKTGVVDCKFKLLRLM
jgi:hypothetical protein